MAKAVEAWRAGDSRRRGLALVSVLWVLTLLALIAASFVQTTRSSVNLTRNARDNSEAEALADAGVYWLLYNLLAERSGVAIQGEEGLTTRASTSGDAETGPADDGAAGREAIRTDATLYTWRFAGGEVLLSAQDEGGRIDLNAANEVLLNGLFLSLLDEDSGTPLLDESQAAAFVDAIVDFADEDKLHRLNGAEDPDYIAAGLPYDAKDAPFEAVEELLQVIGMTRAIYERVAPALTVYSGQPGIDSRIAPREALLAVPGSSEDMVDDYLATRTTWPPGAVPVFPGAESFQSRSRGRILTVRAEAIGPAGARFVRETVARVGRNPAQPFFFLAWKQGRASKAAPADGEEGEER
jgi:general secretion pathway protein K